MIKSLSELDEQAICRLYYFVPASWVQVLLGRGHRQTKGATPSRVKQSIITERARDREIEKRISSESLCLSCSRWLLSCSLSAQNGWPLSGTSGKLDGHSSLPHGKSGVKMNVNRKQMNRECLANSDRLSRVRQNNFVRLSARQQGRLPQACDFTYLVLSCGDLLRHEPL